MKIKGGWCAITYQPLSQLDAGYTAELDVQHKAVEPRLFPIRQKCFGRRIGDWLNAGRPQQPAKGLAKPFIVIDDSDVSLFGAAHWEAASIVDPGAKCRLSSFREGVACELKEDPPAARAG